MRIKISYSDGTYCFREAYKHESNNIVEVPDEVIALWDAIAKAGEEVQDQLRKLDNKLCEEMENG